MTLEAEAVCARPGCGLPASDRIHRIEMPLHAFQRPNRPQRLVPRRTFYVEDAITVTDASQECPRCGSLLYESISTGPACTQATCGWQSRYLRGTTHRADGSAISEGLA